MGSDVFRIEVDGKQYENFTSVEVYKNLETMLGEFSFVASNTTRQQFPFKKGQECKIYCGDNLLITGYINKIRGRYDSQGHSISLSGRDITQDLVDCCINGNMNLKSPVRLESIINKVLKQNGLDKIKISSKSTMLLKSLRPFSTSEIATASVEDTAFKFLEAYCRKRQVLLNTDVNGEILVVRAGSDKFDTVLKCNNDDKDKTNNILEASVDDNDEDRFNQYVIYSQGNYIADLIDNNRENKKGLFKDTEIRASRIIVLNSNISSDIQTNKDRAKWEASIRRARSFVYACKVRGFYLKDNYQDLIVPNKTIKVSDDLLGVNSELLIKSCRYRKSSEDNTTELELVNKDSYTLDIQQKGIEQRFNDNQKLIKGLGI